MSRFWVLVTAFVVTVATLTIALLLGSVAFDYRRYTQHQARLERVLKQHPDEERLTKGLAADGTPLVAAPETAEEIARIIAAQKPDRQPELREKARRWGHLRVYAAADMLYFIFFDDRGIMRDFSCVSRR
jgi:hypothetical protein